MTTAMSSVIRVKILNKINKNRTTPFSNKNERGVVYVLSAPLKGAQKLMVYTFPRWTKYSSYHVYPSLHAFLVLNLP